METSLPTSVDDVTAGAPFRVQAWPSVAAEMIRLAVESDTERSITLEVVDATGSTVGLQNSRYNVPQGISTLTIPAADLATGVYLVRAISGGGFSSCRVVVK